MARVTVEDCIEVIPNRFELVILAAQRAKQISSGAPLMVDRDNDKDGVVALREVAERMVSADTLREEIIVTNCKRQSAEEFEAIPYAGEIEDHLRGQQIAEVMKEEGRMVAAAGTEEAEDEALDEEEGEDDEESPARPGAEPDNLSFEDDETAED